MLSLRILSRRMLPLMHLKLLNFYESLLFLHLLIRPCSVFYANVPVPLQC